MIRKNKKITAKIKRPKSLPTQEKEKLQERYSTYLIRKNYESLNEAQKDYLRMLVLNQCAT